MPTCIFVYEISKLIAFYHCLYSYWSWKWRQQMFKTQVEQRAQRVVSLQSFGHFLTSFSWSIRVQTMVKCDQYVFYNNLGFSCVKVFEFRENLREKRDRVKKITSSKLWLVYFWQHAKWTPAIGHRKMIAHKWFPKKIQISKFFTNSRVFMNITIVQWSRT